jgi:hypothetical protein
VQDAHAATVGRGADNPSYPTPDGPDGLLPAGAGVPRLSSPFTVKTKKLKPGKHTLTVEAIYPAGNPDPTPSTLKFKVKAKPHH